MDSPRVVATSGAINTSDLTPDKYTHVLDLIARVLILLNLAYVPLLVVYWPATSLLIAVELLVVLAWHAVRLLIRRNAVVTARWVSVFVPSIHLGFVALYMGREALVHFFLLAGLMFPFLIFPPNQTRSLYAACALIAATAIGVEVWLVFNEPLFYLAPSFLLIFRWAVIVGLVVFVVGLSHYNCSVLTRVEMQLAVEHRKAESLLLNILPATIASRLKNNKASIAERFDFATVLFADIANFTKLAASLPPTKLVEMLDDIFRGFDTLAEKYGVEKIKTIGDAYMAAAGIPIPCDDHAIRMADMALEMRDKMRTEYSQRYPNLKLRIGIHTGPVVAGVIGTHRFAYDLWGDTVNTASRMESHGRPGGIQVTADLWDLLKTTHLFESRDSAIEVKGKGVMTTYFLLGRQP